MNDDEAVDSSDAAAAAAADAAVITWLHQSLSSGVHSSSIHMNLLRVSTSRLFPFHFSIFPRHDLKAVIHTGQVHVITTASGYSSRLYASTT